jgi:hypothetical protein
VTTCNAVHVETWQRGGKPMEREVRCTLPPGHVGRHGWELDKGDAATKDYGYVREWKISQLVASFASSATRHHAVVVDGSFDLAVARELDQRWAALEARVEQLENHPAGCSCTRCTG